MKLMELYQDKVMGTISGLDRIRFRGTLRLIADKSGLLRFMSFSKVLLKDFGGWAERLTDVVRQSCEQQADKFGIERRYLNSSTIDKENLAREIAERKGISEGPICMFGVVEPCISPMVRGSRESKRLELKMSSRKCVFVYRYFNDSELGFGHVRIQSWLPFNVFVCLNGRHWLQRQLNRDGIGYIKDGNCFPWIADVEAAQTLMDKQLKTEWATDIMFKSRSIVDRLYPSLVHHAMNVSDGSSVTKYLGRCDARGISPREVISDYRRRYEGVRVKHWINYNSVKMYNKSGGILRIETTINNTRDFKVFRHPDDDKGRPASWQKMRKGISDLHRRYRVGQQCNERYADALA